MNKLPIENEKSVTSRLDIDNTLVLIDFLKSIIYQKSVKPVLDVNINNTMILTIQFNNYKITRKITPDLRTFIHVLQHVNFIKCSKDRKYCRSESLRFYDIFGITVGDIIEFSTEDVTSYVYFIE